MKILSGQYFDTKNNQTFFSHKPRAFKLQGVIRSKQYFFGATAGQVRSCPVKIDFLNQAGDRTCSVVAQGCGVFILRCDVCSSLIRRATEICLAPFTRPTVIFPRNLDSESRDSLFPYFKISVESCILTSKANCKSHFSSF